MRLAGRPQTPSGGTARPGTASGRPGSALRQPALGFPVVPVSINTTLPQEAQLEAPAAAAAAAGGGAPEPSFGRQVITSARPGQLPAVAGARPASAGLKRPASAAGQHQNGACSSSHDRLICNDHIACKQLMLTAATKTSQLMHWQLSN